MSGRKLRPGPGPWAGLRHFSLVGRHGRPEQFLRRNWLAWLAPRSARGSLRWNANTPIAHIPHILCIPALQGIADSQRIADTQRIAAVSAGVKARIADAAVLVSLPAAGVPLRGRSWQRRHRGVNGTGAVVALEQGRKLLCLLGGDAEYHARLPPWLI